MAYEQKTKEDRNGNVSILKLAKTLITRKGGVATIHEDNYETFFESGNQLFKINVCPTDKYQDKNGNRACWVKITKMSKQKKSSVRF